VDEMGGHAADMEEIVKHVQIELLVNPEWTILLVRPWC
jgi:hypothetical protein